DEEALRQWELERERLEAERLAKLQDHEVGGEESELTSTGMLPASHISFASGSTPEGERRALHGMAPQNQREGLERKLLTEIGQIAEASPTVKRESYRDSDLTDYDISDFHGNEHIFDNYGSSPAADVQFMNGAQRKPTDTVAAPLTSGERRATGDSDEYVKVNVEPIYDMPPRNEKGMSPEEAKQLQDLYKEYDFGIDIGTEGQPQHQSFPMNAQFSPPAMGHSMTQYELSLCIYVDHRNRNACPNNEIPDDTAYTAIIDAVSISKKLRHQALENCWMKLKGTFIAYTSNLFLKSKR
ncbi:hypothetical protein NECAME_17684, partial [Necator americanus]